MPNINIGVNEPTKWDELRLEDDNTVSQEEIQPEPENNTSGEQLESKRKDTLGKIFATPAAVQAFAGIMALAMSIATAFYDRGDSSQNNPAYGYPSLPDTPKILKPSQEQDLPDPNVFKPSMNREAMRKLGAFVSRSYSTEQPKGDTKE